MHDPSHESRPVRLKGLMDGLRVQLDGWRRLMWIGTWGSMAVAVALMVSPLHSKIMCLGLLMCVGFAWLGFTMLGWKRKGFRMLMMSLPVMAWIPILLPGGPLDGEALRQDYVRRLNQFEGTKYVWGGESSRGIDCSGLPRRAYRDALLACGLRHGNGHAIRAFIKQWWFDASALALGEGYRDDTVSLETRGTIQEMDCVSLMAGDMAVTESGIHVLAYVGNGRWIQADPSVGAVITLDGRTADNGWFRMPVTTHRWRLLMPK